ncbi:MAG TPA: polysaccharide biosynthesis protein, partial [Nitriliruptoraceae bacterium]|nr:polysaccharide biosynthesis protein [Nitriliruptoraceae bacterium]
MDVTVRAALRYVIESVALAMAFVGAFLIRFEGAIPPDRVTQMVVVLPVVVVVQVIALNIAGVGRHSWRYTTLQDLVDIVAALAAVAGVMVVVRWIVGGGAELPWGVFGLPFSVIAADWILAVLGLAGLRAVRRLQSEGSEAREVKARSSERPVKRVVLIGAGRAGVLTVRELRRRPHMGMEPVAFLDDDPAKRGRRVAGLDVIGSVDDIGRVVEDHDVELAVITIAQIGRGDLERIIELCNRAEIGTKIVPGLYEIVSGSVSISRLRDVDMSDLLGRPVVELDDRPTMELIAGRTVMVTGAGGSIGSELVRQLMPLGPGHLVMVDQSEPALWSIHREVETSHPDTRRTAVIADVCDVDRMRRIHAELRPDVVVHAAAHKHVPMMESNPGEAIKNNVGGTRTVLDLALEFGVDRFVMVSTDKAVNPTSVMGATKRLAERYVQHVARSTGFHAASVRFGNVLGSTG